MQKIIDIQRGTTQLKEISRHPKAQSLIQRKNLNQLYKFMLRGFTDKHALEDPDARPVPDMSLSDYRKRFNENLSLVNRQEGGAYKDISFHCFYVSVEPVDFRDGISIDSQMAWTVVRSDDMVLLSDKDTDHYTEISSVDREKRLVRFRDRWPDSFFLNPGMNLIGIECENMTITESEFQTVTVGIITLDSTDFLDAVAATLSYSDPRFLLSVGYSVLSTEIDSMASRAIPILTKSWELTNRKDLEIAAMLYYAYQVAARFVLPEGVQNLKLILSTLEQHYTEEALASNLNAYELGRIGNSLMSQDQPQRSYTFLSRAIERDKTNEMPYWIRSKVLRKLQRNADSQVDLERAISLVESRIEGQKRLLDNIDRRDNDGIEYHSCLLAGLNRRRDEMLAFSLSNG